MALTYQQAIEALSSGEFTTVESLFSLVKSVSAVVPEATKDTIYLLNSGPMPDGFGTSDVTSLLLDGRHVSVGQSEVGKLLRSSVEFETALNRAIRLVRLDGVRVG